MNPYREACAQMENDQRYQAFMDYARDASVPVLLRYVAHLMDGHRDPYLVPAHVQQRYLDIAESEGWAKVIELIAQVQREKEQV
jgi:hypothetical protein